jgi:GTP-binding protein
MILHIIDGTEEDWGDRYKAIRHEMESYGGGLTNKPEIIVINKMDAVEPDVWTERMKKFKRGKKSEIISISAAGRLGIKELISAGEKSLK